MVELAMVPHNPADRPDTKDATVIVDKPDHLCV
jgi:hypothetical protein